MLNIRTPRARSEPSPRPMLRNRQTSVAGESQQTNGYGSQSTVGSNSAAGSALPAGRGSSAAASRERSAEDVGEIHFSMKYDFQQNTFVVRVIEAKRLPAKDFSGFSDPYCVVSLLPKDKYKLQTKIKKRTLNPRWNESFLFEDFPIEKLKTRTLHLHVFDYDRFSRDDPIGELFIPLQDLDFTQNYDVWKPLLPPKSETKNKYGEILLSLKYNVTAGELGVNVIKCKELRIQDIATHSSDPYVKIWLMFGGKKMEKKKTQIHMRDLNPVFNESFTFSVPMDKIREAALLVTVMDYDKIGRNDLIGRVTLSSRSDPASVAHWNAMLQYPKEAVSQWHVLKDEI
ncbi:synaptotagmin-7-like isoform X2 [Paramacrobiotus metropolitanus]|nr:synaptotagmin-7-like isoform X2 [Paramacrobiotus metropolitanus]XP_055355999.1 synaptotagmin-7-like isoform X2 [Paramacrobiotus metropolitanus]XP_055356000.1 synaptotagmin-7-like isoform X2 [Paramacrobiotus metropolitanus]XP_055356001.1 synaptotagmin-7-like isoform X2 [Paramacrobiotus metropolitanus]